MTTDAATVLPENARILGIKLQAGIGDFILLMPALRALRETYPNARIDLLAPRHIERLVRRFHIVDTLIFTPEEVLIDLSQETDQGPLVRFDAPQYRQLLKNLREVHYDAVLLFHHLQEAPLIELYKRIMLATEAKWLVGLENGNGAFLNIKIPDPGFGVRHQAEYTLDLVRALGVNRKDNCLYLPISQEESQQAREMIDELGTPSRTGPIIAMHPGCAFYMDARRWPLEHFAQLADALYRECGGSLLLLGGPEEFSLREQVLRTMQSAMPAKNFSGQESILLTAALIWHCDIFIGNDSGLMHVSTAVGTPTVAIFGLTNHKAWGPYTPTDARKSLIVRQDLPCMPCTFVGHELGNTAGCATRDCLNTLTVDRVFDAARDLLAQNSSRCI